MEERIMVLSALRNIESDSKVDLFDTEDLIMPATTVSSAINVPGRSPQVKMGIEPMLSVSPDIFDKRKTSVLLKDSAPFLALGDPAMPIVTGSGSSFPAVSIITERRARGGPGHDGESHTYDKNDFDEIFE
jgi:hypothetical protein